MSKLNENRRIWLICLMLGLGTLALYWPACHYDFVEYDDPDYVSQNQTVRNGITPYGLMWSVVDAHAANWHPLTWVSHMLDCQLFGLNPGAHHMVNVLFHCANSILLFLLLRTMTGAFWRTAFMVAFFAWHPLRVESVAWISERKDVLSGFFFMLTLLAYVRYTKLQVPGCPSQLPSPQAPVPSPNGKFSMLNAQCSIDTFRSPGSSFYFLSIFLFALGLLSKPMLITVPLILLLLDYWPLGRFEQSPSEPCFLGIPRRLLREKIPFLLLSVLVALITPIAQRSGGAIISLQSEGILPRLENVLTGYLGYLEKIFWPIDLSFLYLRLPSIPLTNLLAAGFVLLAISVFAFYGVVRGRGKLVASRESDETINQRRYLAVGWLWFLIMVLPVSGLFQTGLHSIADRYSYLPSIGVAIMVVWAIGDLVGLISPDRAGTGMIAASGIAALVICIALTRTQLGYWHNTETLMEHALKVDPNNYVAHQDLAVFYSKAGLSELARQHRQRVRELDPPGPSAVAGQSAALQSAGWNKGGSESR